MPKVTQQPNKKLRRAVITGVVALCGLLIAGAVLVNSFNASPAGGRPADAQPPAEAETAGAPAAVPEMEPQPAQVREESVPPDPNAPPLDLASASFRTYPANPTPSVLGSTDPDSGFEARIELHPTYGAGVESITLADYYETYKKQERYRIQSRAASGSVQVASLAAVGIEIQPPEGDPVFYDLRLVAPENGGDAQTYWRQSAAGAFHAELQNPDGETLLRIDRVFTFDPGSHDIDLAQRITNLTRSPLTVRWYQYGPVDLPADRSGYGIDVRRFRYGYLRDPAVDPAQLFVESDDDLLPHSKLRSRATDGRRLWPTESGAETRRTLSWVALTSRYFAFVVHPAVDPDSSAPRAFTSVEEVYPVVIGDPSSDERSTVVLQLVSPPLEIAPVETVDLSIGAYAGPLRRDVLRADPEPRALNLDRLVVYNLGGMCAPCTFQWLTRPLLGILRFVASIVHDWSIAIIVLVLLVRAALHPVTRRSQIGMARFTRQMQRIAPKQQKLREKYKDDPKRMQQEMGRLMREEGVSFTGMLGCLPMFLQSPIWIALYATLFFAVELRQEPAFYGVFQTLTGGWSFLADLSAPDRFVDFGEPLITIPLLGPIRSINILPLLLGVVFFIQQKYLTPPPSTALTPEQEQQQKIMRVMMVVMFPVIMYNAPSGLAIYFITNSALGILESRWIRSHIDQLELDKPGPGADRKRVRNDAPANPFARRSDASRRSYKKRS